MKNLLVVIAALLTCGGAYAVEIYDTADYKISSNTSLWATNGSGNVYIYSGKITGKSDKPILLRGDGTFVFTNPENTYPGTYRVGYSGEGVVLRMDEAGAFSASNTVYVYNTNLVNQAQLTHEGGVYDCNFLCTDHDATYVGWAVPPFLVKANCTINGTFTVASKKTIAIAGDSDKSAVFNGNLSFNGRSPAKGILLRPGSNGKFTINGSLLSDSTYPGPVHLDRVDDATGAPGTVELCNTNRITTLNYGYTKLVLNAENALDDAVLKLSVADLNYDLTGYGDITLKANQNVKYIDCDANTEYENCGAITSDQAVELRVSGDTAPVCYSPINGEITLIKENASKQIMKGRASLTTGAIMVKGGTLELQAGATFKNISKLSIGDSEEGTSATLTIASSVTESPFADTLPEIDLFNGGMISSESQAITLTTTNFKVNGETVASYGEYTASDYPNAIGSNVAICYQPAVKNCYVDAVNGDDDNSGLAENAAKKTLNALFSTVTLYTGDTVWVKPGTYDSGYQLDSSNECARVIIPDGITLRSTGGKAVTIIEGGATGGGAEGADPIRCVRMTGSTSRLIGFTLRNGKGAYGGGVAAYVCDDETGKWSRGGLVADCTIEGCLGHGSGCVYANVVRTLFKDCGKSGSNTGVAGRNVRCYNCVFDGNGASSSNYDLYNDSAAVNCTFVNGSALAVRKVKNVKNCLILRTNGVHGENKFYRTYINREWNGSDNNFTDECQSTAEDAALATGLRVKSDYVPLRSNLGIGQGNVEYIDDDYPTALDYLENGYNYDFYQHARTTDGKVDLGAVERSGFPTVGTMFFVY